MYLTTFLFNFAEALCQILFYLMLARAICSMLFRETDNALTSFLYAVTEFFILPIRALCDRFGWFRHSMMDMPFLMASMLLWLVQILLSAVSG